MRKVPNKIAIFSALVATTFALSKQELDELWAPSTTIDEDKLPIRISEKLYDEIVVDPMTNDIYPGLPWFVYFYSRNCHFCQEFKPEFEDFASRLTDIARFGMIDAHECEYIKESWRLKYYPTLALMYNGMVYEYEGYRTFESIRAFIKQDHIYINKQYEIPPHIGQLGLWMRYAERDIPRYEKKLDELFFSKLDLHEKLTTTEKAAVLGGIALVLFLVPLLMICCCCCKTKKKVSTSKQSPERKPSSKIREKID